MIICCITRFVRKKIILGLVFGLSLSYFVYNFYDELSKFYTAYSSADLDVAPIESLNYRILMWNENDDGLKNSSNKQQTICRNSVQGKRFIVDDKGFICKREDIQSNGCCSTSNSTDFKRYSCDTCSENGCCEIYEYCVSCCLHPNKKSVLKNFLGIAHPSMRIILSAVRDQFELCIVKCRTSSLSVHHENSYLNPSKKHCYMNISLAVNEGMD